MTEQIGVLTAPGIVETDNIKRYEHHKVIVSVSNYVSPVIIRIEEVVGSSTNAINLDELDRSFTLTKNGDEAYVLENMRIDTLRLNFVSGDAELKVLYEGF